MVTTIIDLNLKDPGVTPVIYVSKLDSGLRAFEFHLYDGSEEYQIPLNASVTFQGTKPDKNGFVYGCTFNNNIVTVDCDEQMTAVVGETPCSLVIIDIETNRVASFLIIMMVLQTAVNDNTVFSDSDIAYANEVINSLQSIGAFASSLNSIVNKINTIQMTYISSEERINFNNP